jgi:chromosome segregation ATPase
MNYRKTLLALSLLTMLLSSPATAQTTRASIPDVHAAAAGDSDEQVIARLAAEVTAGRAAVAEKNAEIDALEAQLSVEKANGESLSKSYADATREIEQLRSATDALGRAVALNEQTIKLLTDAKQKAEHRAKKANKRAVIATLTAVGMALFKFGVL